MSTVAKACAHNGHTAVAVVPFCCHSHGGHSAGTVVPGKPAYDGNGPGVAQSTTRTGTLCDQSAEKQAESDSLNSGTAYDVNLVGNS